MYCSNIQCCSFPSWPKMHSVDLVESRWGQKGYQPSRNKEGPLCHLSTKSQENLQEHLHNSCSRANREIPGSTWEKGDGWTLLQVSKGSCGVSTHGDSQNWNQAQPWTTLSNDPALSRGIGLHSLRRSLLTSVILWKRRQSKLDLCSIPDFKDYVGRCGNTSHAELSKEREDLPCFCCVVLGKIKRWRKPGPV